MINPEKEWGPLLENDRMKANYSDAQRRGSLGSAFHRLRKRTQSRETLARSRVSELKHAAFRSQSLNNFFFVFDLSLSDSLDHYRMMIGKIICFIEFCTSYQCLSIA